MWQISLSYPAMPFKILAEPKTRNLNDHTGLWFSFWLSQNYKSICSNDKCVIIQCTKTDIHSHSMCECYQWSL